MNDAEISKKLSYLDGRGSAQEFEAVEWLCGLGSKFPILLLNKYRQSKKYGERASCVYHAISFACTNDSAYQLGIEALKDKSKHVRYRACMLLAVAQKKSAVPALSQLLKYPHSAGDAEAAIDAITNNNHNYFVDRDHSGNVTLNV